MRFTNEEKHAEALREVGMRNEVYGRNAPGGFIPPAQMRRIDIMQEIADEYLERAKGERLL